MFANPYTIVAALLFAIGLFGAGVSVGYKYEAGANARALAAAQDTAIKAANAANAAEKERALAAAKTEADERVKATRIRGKGELDAYKKSRVACARDAESMGLLQQSISAANGEADTPAVVPKPVSATGRALEWIGVGSAKVGIQDNRSVRPVPPPSR